MKFKVERNLLFMKATEYPPKADDNGLRVFKASYARVTCSNLNDVHDLAQHQQ